jgi:SAM-dependent methyltransferase
MSDPNSRTLARQTIADFGDQWTRFTDNEGFYGSATLFEDICGPLLPPDSMAGQRAAEIGSGTGRIVRMMIACGAAHVVAVEPSAAFDVLQRNVEEYGGRVECVRATGEQIPRRGFDLVLSIGVLHHIPEPAPVVRAAFDALKPGGRILVWLYGREGNALYLSLTLPLRAITTRLPHQAVHALARAFTAALIPYVWLCRRLPLPLAGYFANVFGHMERGKQVLIVYDQLRPAYAKYYSRSEAIALLADAGFVDVRAHHRHGYSWTVMGTRPR